jgi:anhydro-N-acetylmuramic acid kinase
MLGKLPGRMIRALGAAPEEGGVRAALIETDGVTIAAFGETTFRPYSPAEAALIWAARSHGPDAALVEVVETTHASAMSRLPGAVIAGFDGLPPEGGGDQCNLGCGSILAEVLGLPVVWDFHASDLGLGGLGGPIDPFFHFACARRAGLTAPVAFLILGPVCRLIWVDPARARAEEPGACLTFDVGPGVVGHGAGQVDGAVIDALMQNGYFLKMPPKLAPAGAFAAYHRGLAALDPPDAAATSRAALAAALARGFEHLPTLPDRLLVQGQADAALLCGLAASLGCPVAPVASIGLDGDAMGAQALAYLAVRVARGLPTTGPGTTGVAAAVGGGQISRPSSPQPQG